jgi:hypothetical protein
MYMCSIILNIAVQLTFSIIVMLVLLDEFTD